MKFSQLVFLKSSNWTNLSLSLSLSSSKHCFYLHILPKWCSVQCKTFPGLSHSLSTDPCELVLHWDDKPLTTFSSFVLKVIVLWQQLKGAKKKSHYGHIWSFASECKISWSQNKGHIWKPPLNQCIFFVYQNLWGPDYLTRAATPDSLGSYYQG